MARQPLYKKAEAEMTRRIRSGEWEVGRRLPNEFGLADEFGVSQGTMRRALMTLEAQGYLDRKPGRGTVVAKPKRKSVRPAAGGSVRFDHLRLHAPLEVFRENSTSRRADTAEEALFGSTPLLELTRTLKSNGARFALEKIAFPETHIGALPDGLPAEFADLLQELGLVVARLEDTVAAAITSMGESVALEVDRNTPLLCVERVARDGKGQVLARQRLRIGGAAGYVNGA